MCFKKKCDFLLWAMCILYNHKATASLVILGSSHSKLKATPLQICPECWPTLQKCSLVCQICCGGCVKSSDTGGEYNAYQGGISQAEALVSLVAGHLCSQIVQHTCTSRREGHFWARLAISLMENQPAGDECDTGRKESSVSQHFEENICWTFCA